MFARAGPALLHPCDGPHHSEGVRDGLLPHADRRAQPPGLGLSQEPLRHRGCQVSLTFIASLVNLSQWLFHFLLDTHTPHTERMMGLAAFDRCLE